MQPYEKAFKLLATRSPELITFLATVKIFDVDLLTRSLESGAPLAQLFGETFEEPEAFCVAFLLNHLLLVDSLSRWHSKGDLQGYTLTPKAENLPKTNLGHLDVVAIREWAVAQHDLRSVSDAQNSPVYSARTQVLRA